MAFRVSTLHTASGQDVCLEPALASDEALEDLRRSSLAVKTVKCWGMYHQNGTYIIIYIYIIPVPGPVAPPNGMVPYSVT